MNLIITMAGKYSRFKNEGYRLPKYLLPWGNRSILSEILLTMHKHFENVYLIMNKNDNDYKVHIRNIMKEYNINLNNLILIEDTDSQSQSLLKGLELINNLKGPIVVHNVDTVLYNRDYVKIKNNLSISDGFIDVFESNNPAYSYVLLNKLKEVKEIAEKILISNTASSGLYGFSSKEVFEKYYSNGYISTIYKNMIENNLTVTTGVKYDETNTIVLGTPYEYMNLSKLILRK